MLGQLQLLDAPATVPSPHARAGGGVDGVAGGVGSENTLILSVTNPVEKLNIWKKFLADFGADFQANWQQYERQYYQRIDERRKRFRAAGGNDHEFERQLGKIDLYYLAKHVLPYGDCTFHLHFIVCRFLQLEDLPYKFLMLPRGHFKTSLAHARRVQKILNNPDIAILVATGTAKLVRAFTTEMKSMFLFCDAFRALYPEFCPPPNDRDWGTLDHFVVPNRRDYSRAEPTVQVATTGTKLIGGHYDIQDNDDLVNDENCDSAELLDALEQWYADLKYLTRAKSRYEQTNYGTRYHYGDLYGKWLADKLEDGGRFACYIRTAIEHGKALCPTVKSLDMLEADRGTDPKSRARFAAQMMMDPVAEDASLKPADITYYHEHDGDFLRECKLFLNLDAAISQNERADYSAFVVSAATPDGFLDLVEYTEKRMNEKEFVAELFRLWDKFKKMECPFTAITLQRAVIEQVFRSAIQEEMERRKEYLPLVPISVHKRDKLERIRRIMPRFQNKKARLLACHTSMETQLLQFPKGAHEDLLDAWSDVEEVLEFPIVEVAPEPRKEYRGTTMNEAQAALSKQIWDGIDEQEAPARRPELIGVTA